MNFGDILREHLARNDMSQQQLADAIGCAGGRASVNNWVSGYSLPNLRFALRIAKVLKFSLDSLDPGMVATRSQADPNREELARLRKIARLKKRVTELENWTKD